MVFARSTHSTSPLLTTQFPANARLSVNDFVYSHFRLKAGQSAGLWTVGPGGVLTLEGAFHHVLSACVRRELFRFMLSKILKSKILDLQFSFEFAMP